MQDSKRKIAPFGYHPQWAPDSLQVLFQGWFTEIPGSGRFYIAQLAGGSMRLIENSRSLIQSAFIKLVEGAIAGDDLRPDTDPNDFVRALIGIFHTTAIPGWEQSARRIVNILIDGSRLTISKSASRKPRKARLG